MTQNKTNRAGFGTRAIHAGQEPDPTTGAIMTPIYATSTYVQESPGVHKGYEYSRSQNPTRMAFEACVADLENGARGYAFASGLAAMGTILELLDSGADFLIRDTFESSVKLAEEGLRRLEFNASEIERLIEEFRRADSDRLLRQKADGIYATAEDGDTFRLDKS